VLSSDAVPRKLFRVAAVIATVARTPHSSRAGHSNGREKSLVITLAAFATVVPACRRAPGNAGFDRSVSVCPPSCPGISRVPSTSDHSRAACRHSSLQLLGAPNAGGPGALTFDQQGNLYVEGAKADPTFR
jgi:hypothetical protein